AIVFKKLVMVQRLEEHPNPTSRQTKRLNEISPWGYYMLLLIGIVLFVLWILGFTAFHVAGGLIHLLLVFAVISIIWHLVAGRRATV
ncbi:MAG: lmo0937 family membrane protein, partial [Candidatus Angelobacter sp.]